MSRTPRPGPDQVPAAGSDDQRNPYGEPFAPLSAKEIRRQKRMSKAGRSWFARHKFLTGVLGVAAVGTVAAAVGGGEGETDDREVAAEPSPSSSAPSSAPDTAPADAGEEAVVEVEEVADEPAAPGIGEATAAGDLAITVTGVESGLTQVGSEYVVAEAQGQYVLVHVTITNEGNESENFWEQDATLVDDQGRVHDTSSDSIYLEGETGWLVTSINPGNTAEGTLLFDIPADAVPDLARFSPGLFSDDVDIALR
ncbi:Mpr protein [Actinomycetales bacterium JB111]|nr:Mpr protein [Actinomycetales bacterium JB111]